MPDIGWMELLVIGVVALIVVGPEDLPKMFQKLGQMVGRVRGMAREFTSAMNAAADDAGMTEMNRDLRAAAKFTNPKKMAREMMGGVMEDIDPSQFEEGSATRIIAEKKLAAQQQTRERVAALRASREAAETSAEPEGDEPIPSIAAAQGKTVTPKAAASSPVEAAPKEQAAEPKASSAQSTTAKTKAAAAKPKASAPEDPSATAAPKAAAKPRAKSKAKPATETERT